MALTKEFFEKIDIELVKRKYYNANKVDALLSTIRAEALRLSDENESLRKQLEALQSQKAEISEAVMSAQRLHSEIVQKANARADEAVVEARTQAEALVEEAKAEAARLVEKAQQQAQEILARAADKEEKARAIHDELLGSKQQRQEYAVGKVESCFAMLRQRHQDAIDALNLQWQEFLCGLYEDESFPEKADPAAPVEDVAPAETEARPENESAGEATPADLGEKVDAIAKELEAL